MIRILTKTISFRTFTRRITFNCGEQNPATTEEALLPVYNSDMELNDELKEKISAQTSERETLLVGRHRKLFYKLDNDLSAETKKRVGTIFNIVSQLNEEDSLYLQKRLLESVSR